MMIIWMRKKYFFVISHLWTEITVHAKSFPSFWLHRVQVTLLMCGCTHVCFIAYTGTCCQLELPLACAWSKTCVCIRSVEDKLVSVTAAHNLKGMTQGALQQSQRCWGTFFFLNRLHIVWLVTSEYCSLGTHIRYM